jgi:hypothetical protein
MTHGLTHTHYSTQTRQLHLNPKRFLAGHRWLTPVILATQEADIRRIVVQSQPRQTVQETLSWKNTSQKRAGGVAQSVGLEFKPKYLQKKKKRERAQRSYKKKKCKKEYCALRKKANDLEQVTFCLNSSPIK